MLAFATAVLAAGWWLSENWSGIEDQIVEAAIEIRDEADVFGADHNQKECLPEARRRGVACPPMSMSCIAGVGGFYTFCLDFAHTSPDLCDEVPVADDSLKSSLWPAQECSRRGWQSELYCATLFEVLLAYCAEARKASAEAI